MAYIVTKEPNGIIKVTGTIIGWQDTVTYETLIDLENHKKMCVGDKQWYNMTDEAVKWVKKYYLPKIKQNNEV